MMKLAQFISRLFVATKLISTVLSYNYGARSIDHFKNEVVRIATVNRTSGHHRILWDPNKSDWAFHPESPLHILVSAFELNYTLVFPLDNSYGTQTNGIFSGILGLLQNQEADVGMGLFSVIEERLQCVNYSTYLGSDTFTILMKNMESVSKVEGIVAPFQNFVWCCVMITSLLMGLVIYVFMHYIETEKESKSRAKPRLGEIYWFIYGALLRQSSSYDPDTNATRTLFGTWWIFVVIMSASYTGGLTAFMTSPDNTLPVNNLQDLETRSSAKWVTVKGTALESFIKNEPILKSLRIDLENGRGRLVDTLEEATQRVLTEEETYFLVEKAVAEREILKGHIQLFKEVHSDSSKLTCPLTIPRQGYQFLHLPYGLVVAKGASRDLMPFMNQKIGEVMDNGMFHRALRLRKPAEKLLLDICTTQDDQKLTLRDFLATFGIILLGYVISSMVLSGEYFFNLIKTKNATQVYQIQTGNGRLQPNKLSISRLEFDMSYAKESSEF